MGDLGNDVTTEMLVEAFSSFPHYNKAKVIRDKLTGKGRGFGFVSFSDPLAAAQAKRAMHRKYIGNRPCHIKISRSEKQDMANVKKKKKKRERELREMGI